MLGGSLGDQVWAGETMGSGPGGQGGRRGEPSSFRLAECDGPGLRFIWKLISGGLGGPQRTHLREGCLCRALLWELVWWWGLAVRTSKPLLSSKTSGSKGRGPPCPLLNLSPKKRKGK